LSIVRSGAGKAKNMENGKVTDVLRWLAKLPFNLLWVFCLTAALPARLGFWLLSLQQRARQCGVDGHGPDSCGRIPAV
jgi:hypothetical protein